MLDALKRWIGSNGGGHDARAMLQWSRQRGLAAKRVRDGHGIVVEGALHAKPWRMEWGTPQRAYLIDRELRLRMDLGLPQGAQMLVASRALAEELEQAAYTLLTQDMQTQIDSGMPEEMRWLAMYPKAHVAAAKVLRARYTCVSGPAAPLHAWLDGNLLAQLQAAAEGWLGEDMPIVLMTLRGRLYLRTEAPQPDAAVLEGALQLFEVAARSAWAATDGVSGQPTWPSSGTTAWQSMRE